MSRWRRTVPAILFFLMASLPMTYFQVGNIVYTQAAASSPDCSGHSPETLLTTLASPYGTKT